MHSWNLAELPGGRHSTPLVVGDNDCIVYSIKETRAKQGNIYDVYTTYIYGNLESENRGHTGGLRS